MEIVNVVDFFGREIKVGQLITYPTRSGSSMYQNWAIIKEISIYEKYGEIRQKLICYKVERNWRTKALICKLITIFRTSRTIILTENIEDAISKNIISNEMAECIKIKDGSK